MFLQAWSPGRHPNLQARGEEIRPLPRGRNVGGSPLKRNHPFQAPYPPLSPWPPRCNKHGRIGDWRDRPPAGEVILVGWRPASPGIYHPLWGSTKEGNARRPCYLGRVAGCRHIPLPPRRKKLPWRETLVWRVTATQPDLGKVEITLPKHTGDTRAHHPSLQPLRGFLRLCKRRRAHPCDCAKRRRHASSNK